MFIHDEERLSVNMLFRFYITERVDALTSAVEIRVRSAVVVNSLIFIRQCKCMLEQLGAGLAVILMCFRT